MVKHFVLDTNILLRSPRAMVECFEENHVIITGTTLQELDSKKEQNGEIGYNAREAIRILDRLRKTGDLCAGVPTECGGTLSIEPGGVDAGNLPDGFSISVPDNRILSTCISLKFKESLNPLILVTNDISMRVNASTIGIDVEEFLNEQVKVTDYTGHSEAEADRSLIDRLYREKTVEEFHIGRELQENEFLIMKAGTQSALCVHHKGKLCLIPEQKTFGGVSPMNSMQSFALWALRSPADEIPLVILTGAAGTAKTFLSLAAGLEHTYVSQRRGEGAYHKILLSRPNGIGFSNIGFLPGDLDRKLSPLMASYYDNMEILLSNGGEIRETIQMQMDEILETGVVEVCSLDFIRGRSLQNTYIICDEAQNASRGLIRDVITRAGHGTKVVLAGDPGQIDVPSLDMRNNGLTYAAYRMGGKTSLCAYCSMDARYSVRSPLAKKAVELM